MGGRPSRGRRASPGRSSGLPSRAELLRHLEQSPHEVTKRDLVRAFRVEGWQRTAFKQMLRDLEADGMLARGPRRRLRPNGRLPGVAVLEVSALDPESGDLLARPTGIAAAEDDDRGPAPEVRITLTGRDRRAPGLGERVLARLTQEPDGGYQGQIIRLLPAAPSRVVGVLERAGARHWVRPLDRRHPGDLEIGKEGLEGALPGELVVAERQAGAPLGTAQARITERLGQPDDPRGVSLAAAHGFGLPVDFPSAAEAQAARARPVAPSGRVDLRDLPLITIDGADARDFDDAVAAVSDDDPANPGGWQVVVAIADVAHYVRPGDSIDVEARRRGNSVYFPDRVLPMLPAALSADLCSLRPDENRACVAVRIVLDRRGNMMRHRFERGLMRSRARLTYDQVQAAADGTLDAVTAPLHEPVIQPLYGAFAALLEARRARGTLDLDLPELEVRLDEGGRPSAVEPRPRLDAHRLIEELMIAANVAAAQTLEAADWPCMYRVHDRPDPVKLEGLAQLLEQLGLGRVRAGVAKPKDLARLLARCDDQALAPLISQMILRAQSQATYSPDNIGHFGLNLARYAHFTSPIRRYADLMVHRALIRALGLGAGGLEDGVDHDHMRQLGGRLSRFERRAMDAERHALGRFVALLLAERVGSRFGATVVGVQRFGLFVRLDDSLAEGLVPVSTLGDERFTHHAGTHALIGQRSRATLALGDRVEVELVEVDVLTGQLAFRLLDHTPGPAARAAARGRGSRPQRPRR